jgi:hypothetical protein
MDRPSSNHIAVWRNVSAESFSREILPLYRPAVFKGLVSDWPVVQQARESTKSFLHYLAGLDSGQPVNALLMRPEAAGRVFYDDRLQGFNYIHNRLPLTQLINQLWRYSQLDVSPGLAVQSALLAECMPGFSTENRLPLLSECVAPRFWMGNKVITPAHFDESHNIACVVAGRRRFTLFAPEQIGNLYIGPLDFAPTGTPISLVDFNAPDYEKFPRFKQAMQSALTVDLEPGDALYIPPLWWHHVQSLQSVNALVNYWWRGDAVAGQPGETLLPILLQSVKGLASLPEAERTAWRALFDYYVFQASDDTHAHIPAERLGILDKN